MAIEAELVGDCAALIHDVDPKQSDPVQFLGERFDRGLAWVHFPVGAGGRGLEPRWQPVVDRALASAGAPSPAGRNVIGLGMAAPTLLAHGSAEQQRRHLRPLFTGEEIWCQLFSEPDAGSDVAGLATRAVRDGDDWVVNGQKVWTSFAHLARWGLLAARTDPTVPKHRGLTYFVVDMHQAGVEVRPLHQLTGEAEFNEVHLDDARIPDRDRLGTVGDGWSVVLTTLMNERVAIGGGVPRVGGGFIGEAVRLWQRSGVDDAARRDRLLQLWVRAEVLRLTNVRARHQRAAGTPGPEGAIGKLASGILNQDIATFAVDLLGADGMLYPDGYERRRPEHAVMWADPQQAFLRARGNTIEGGTTEIAKNILGERVLGLPGDVRVDKDRPWGSAR